MKLINVFVIACIFLFAGCEGPEGSEGLVGPQGSQGLQGDTGDQGPSGAIITPITGVIGVGDYQGVFARLNNSLFDEFNVCQVYLTLTPSVYPWAFCSDYFVSTGYVLIYDPDQDFLGWSYLILVIKEQLP